MSSSNSGTGERNLFTPIQLGPYELGNRLVMAPMTRSRAGEGNAVTDLTVEYYAQRASAGLIVTEGTQVSPQGVGYTHTPGIHSDAQAAAWRRVTDAVHAQGGRIFAQLWHVGRVSHPSFHGGALPVAPSAIGFEGQVLTYEGMQPYVAPRALETDEIAGVVAQFAAAAQRAYDAGFDGVELHGANGYLIDEFLRDGSNQRTDRYGGSVENRTRFLLEVAAGVVNVWGGARVGVRVSPRNPNNGMSDSDPVATFSHAADALNPFGLAYLHVLEAVSGPMAQPGVRVTPALRAAFRGPLIANGGYTAESGNAAIANGEADLVAYGAAFLANPDLPNRFRQGAALNPPDRATFYGGDARGYTDYPTLEELAAR
ncbi:MAG TPA: alkene reductase [Longimicrobium sp.]|jgi:N-ethylmaleimide reductase|nr:alkene reductase [Longimicrobium sp.]